jgi:hypothetical protein
MAHSRVLHWRFCDIYCRDIESTLNPSLANLDQSEIEQEDGIDESISPLVVPLGSLAKDHRAARALGALRF